MQSGKKDVLTGSYANLSSIAIAFDNADRPDAAALDRAEAKMIDTSPRNATEAAMLLAFALSRVRSNDTEDGMAAKAIAAALHFLAGEGIDVGAIVPCYVVRPATNRAPLAAIA